LTLRELPLIFQLNVPAAPRIPPRRHVAPRVLVLLALSCNRASSISAGERLVEPLALTATGTVVPVGVLGRAPHYEMRVLGSRECGRKSDEPQPARMRLAVDVTLRATASLQVPANPYYALLIDADNVVYEASLVACMPPLRPGLLAGGETARGWLFFEIPRGNTGLSLAYAPALMAAEPEELAFTVPR
jgi:hypothetical protein